MIDAINNKIQTNTFLKIIFSHFVFTMTYMCVIFMYDINFLIKPIGIIHPLFIGWGMLVSLYTVFISGKFKSIFGKKIILTFFFVTFLSAVWNYNLGVISVFYNWVQVNLLFFTVFSLFFLTTNRKKSIAQISIVFVLCTFILSLISLFMYYFKIFYTVSFGGKDHTCGLVPYFNADGSASVVLFGGYLDSNRAAIYIIISIALSFVLLSFIKNGVITKYQKPIKILAIANLISEICYFPLANSRGAYISLFISIFAVGIFFNSKKLVSKKGISKLLTASFLILASFVICVASYYSIIMIRTVEANITKLTYSIVDSYYENNGSVDNSKDDSDNNFLIDPDQFDKVNATEGIFGMRGEIWKECYEVFKLNPVLGTATHSGIVKVAKENDIGIYLRNNKETHNSYIDLTLCTGALGGAIYFIFLLLALIKICKISYHIKTQNRFAFYCIFFAFVSILSSAFLMKILFLGPTISYLMMLLLLGYILSEPIPQLNKQKEYLLPKSQVKKGEINE